MAKRSFTPLHPRNPTAPTPDPIPRINDLIRTAKAGWLGLLAYLAYVGVTLMGVIDADFFMPEKQTQLPLIGVSIPTTMFFAIAPLLGAMLFAYLHLYLLKLWEALAEAPARIGATPLGDNIAPWLVADFALSHRREPALRPRPLRRLANVVSALLVFAATPAVLTGFWWRSMPKHDEALTVIACGIPLFAAIHTALTSWLRLQRLAQGKPTLPLWGRSVTWGWRGGFVALALMGWMTTEGTLEHYARVTGFYDAQHQKLVAELNLLDEDVLKTRFAGITDYPDPSDLDYLADRELETRWWTQTWLPDLLVPAQLAGTVFVETPPDWLPYDQARHAFWLEQCAAEGLTPTLCGHQLDPEAANLTELPQLRLAWCQKTFPTKPPQTETTCEGFFATLDSRIGEAWKIVRGNAIATLPKRDLSLVDLRFAYFGDARMAGADLSDARMEGAALRAAQMDGVNLSRARMVGADLTGATLEMSALGGARMSNARLNAASMAGANLSYARMEGTDLQYAHIEKAKLFDTRMAAADLHGAQLRGADLSYANLQDANLYQAQIQRVNLRGAKMQGANLFQANAQETDFSAASLQQAILNEAWVQNANLREANLQDAQFRRSHLQGADLSDAYMQDTDLLEADLEGAVLEGALMQGTILRETDLTLTTLPKDQLLLAFGDGTVTLPGGQDPNSNDWPNHWPKLKLNGQNYFTELAKFRASPSTYTPPPPPTP